MNEDFAALPGELEDLLADVFWREPESREARLDALVRDHPVHAASLRARYAALEALTVTAETSRGAALEDPERIGPYRILRRLGEGGFGVVYLADQDHPRRHVALKVLKSGRTSPRTLARFRQELETLANMRAPYIAQVYDAGEDAAGRPYFALEFVEGSRSLTRYCREEDLPLRATIDLFQKVCEGVQHAHQRGVLHRDLKPQNILVTEEGGEPIPKLIDFGIARALDPESVGDTLRSVEGQFIGTPAYTSPEQARGSRDLDTRTDVYSLGVILYELLVGRRPIDDADLSGVSNQLELVDLLENREFDRPSTRASRASDTASGTSSADLRGDLDWIVMKAIAKDRVLRYATPADLSTDLQRYLDHQPVLAGPPDLGYRVSKFIRRYRVQVAAAFVVFLALVGGLVGVTSFWREALAQERLAQRNLDQFNLLAASVRLRQAREKAEAMWPARPERAAELKAWLDRDAETLRADRVAVRAARRTLRARGRPADPRAVERILRSHPDREALERLRKYVHVQSEAAKVARGEAKYEPVAFDPDDYPMLNKSGWLTEAVHEFLAPERIEFGKEGLALELFRAARPGIEASGRLRLELDCLHALALATLGLDEEARTVHRSLEGRLGEHPSLRRMHERTARILSDRDAILKATDERRNRMEERILAGRQFAFESTADDFLHGALTNLELELEAFFAEGGLVEKIEDQWKWCRALEELSSRHPRAGATWSEAGAAIAKADGVVAHPDYAQSDILRELKPQRGLVPIGMNPETKLWEFYHPRSAWDGGSPLEIDIPVHRPDGSIPVTEATGIVFVLLPGGETTIGATRTQGGKNYDRFARTHEVPTRTVRLDPFFLARHELTQIQWMRLARTENPSALRPTEMDNDDLVTSLTHPVENVSWTDVDRVLARHSLELPTAAQWEYGCRAGTETPWFCGATADPIQKYGNLMDESTVRARPNYRGRPVAPWDDGFPVHAPVGSFLPNAFGLHDTIGNVSEFCRDMPGSTFDPLRDGDGWNETQGEGKVRNSRRVRGGSFLLPASWARSASAMVEGIDDAHMELGLRAARRLDR